MFAPPDMDLHQSMLAEAQYSGYAGHDSELYLMT